jgi:hypothetical protein
MLVPSSFQLRPLATGITIVQAYRPVSHRDDEVSLSQSPKACLSSGGWGIRRQDQLAGLKRFAATILEERRLDRLRSNGSSHHWSLANTYVSAGRTREQSVVQLR